MYVCSARVAVLTLAGPTTVAVLLFALLFIFRRWTNHTVAMFAKKIRSGPRYAVPPVITTLFFTITWAGTHYGMAFDFGVLPQILFPLVAGLFAWAAMRYDPSFRRTGSLGILFARRDKVPLLVRIILALVCPAVLSLSITFQHRVTHPAFKEQTLVVVTLVMGYILLSPMRVAKSVSADWRVKQNAQ